MGIEALLSTQIIDTTTVGRAVMTAADAAAARTAIGAGTSSFSGAYSALSGIPSTFAPSAHKTSHATGGSDALTAADIGAAATSHTHTAADITSGTIATARLASGTANSTTYLRGDQTWASVSAGVSSLNGLTDATQTFAVGTSGTNFAISSASGVHTFNLPDASTTARGVVTTGAQTIAGQKTIQAQTATDVPLTVQGAASQSAAALRFLNSAGQLVFQVTASGQVDAGRKTAASGSFLAAENGSGYVFDGGWGGFIPAVTSLGGTGNRISSAGNIQLVCASGSAVAIGNSTNAAKVQVYNTFTSDTSFERLGITWATNICTIETEKGSAGGTLRGLRIGGSSSALVGLWGATPIAQPTTAVAASTRVGGGGTAVTDSDTFDGYTLAQIVKALRNIGALA